MKTLVLALALLTGLFLAGCSTPATRIQQNPAAFDRATPAQQELIKQGKVDIGFDTELVELALGAPDRTKERIDASGKKFIWSYVNYEAANGAYLYRGWYHRGWDRWGGSYWGGGPYYAFYTDYPDRRERERFRIVFKDGKVTEIEHES